MTALINVFVILAVVVGALGAALGRLHGVRQRLLDDAAVYRLHFSGEGLAIDAVEHLLAGLTGWRAPWWKPWASPVVVFELHVTQAGVEHRVFVPVVWVASFEGLVAAHLGGVHVERIERPATTARVAVSFRLNTPGRQLRIEPVAQSRTLLTSLQQLAIGESITLAWSLMPQGPVAAPTAGTPRTGSTWWGPRTIASDEASALRQKQSAPGLGAVLRIGAQAANDGQAHALVRRVESSLHLSNDIGVHFSRAHVPNSMVVKRLIGRMVPVGVPPISINISELVGPLGLPIGSSLPPGMATTGCRPLRASEALPEVGTVIGDSDVAGDQRPVAIDLQGRTRHVLMTGPTGVGKSNLMLTMILDDLQRDRAVLVIDPKADLVDAVLERMPAKRRGDVTILDPSDATRPVGFNVLRSGTDLELAVEQLVSIFHRVWASSWGVRTEDLFRAALRTLIVDPDASLADVGPLLTDASFRARLVPKLTDPTLVAFWASFEALSDGERSQWSAPPLNKWRALMSRTGIRRVLGQAAPTFDLAHALDNSGVVLVPLSAGVLGTDAASLFGSFVLGSVWNFIQARASSTVRSPLMIHLDEASRLASAVPLDELLSQARSYNVGVTLAVQHLTQLSPDLRHTVMANPRSRVAFQPSHDDAQVLARQFGLGLTAEDLQGLDPHTVVAQLYAAGRTQPACTLRTRRAPEPSVDGGQLRRESAERWGSDGAEVDAWLMKRMTGEGRDTRPRKSPGRRPRSGS